MDQSILGETIRGAEYEESDHTGGAAVALPPGPVLEPKGN